MSRIKIRNFGPIKEGLISNNGWIEISKVAIFTGNQGSGKSTVAKLISTFLWIEKALVRGDFDTKWFERNNRLKTQFLHYHRLENYISENSNQKTVIEYIGDAYTIKYEDAALIIEETNNSTYLLPQIMYVPAERNFIAYVKRPKELKLTSGSLKEFLAEYDNALKNMKGISRLPINNVDLEYDRLNDILNIKGGDYKIFLSEASSGFQSLIPLYLVSDYLAGSIKKQNTNEPAMSNDELNRFKKGVKEIWSNDNLTEEQRRVALTVLSSKFNKSAFINIVEEPEQNLYPDSQWQMLTSLLEFNNYNGANKLIVTTHSPYIINYLSVLVKADQLKARLDESLRGKLNEIVPTSATIQSDFLKVYEFDEKIGAIELLDNYEGLPSDDNDLNNGIAKINELFSNLLDIEDLCQ